jgi:uncharacterized protein YlxW (UPF0749 family)
MSNLPAETTAALHQNPDLLQRIVSLAKEQITLEKEITDLEAQVKSKMEKLNIIAGGFQQEGLLPLAMDEAGNLESLKVDGLVVTVKEELKLPSLAKEAKGRQTVLNWVTEIGEKGIIKDELKIPFASLQDNKEHLEKLLKLLEELKIEGERYQTIHPQTFKSLINEILSGEKFQTCPLCKGQGGLPERPCIQCNGKKVVPIDVPMEKLGIMEFRRTSVDL